MRSFFSFNHEKKITSLGKKVSQTWILAIKIGPNSSDHCPQQDT